MQMTFTTEGFRLTVVSLKRPAMQDAEHRGSSGVGGLGQVSGLTSLTV